MDFLLDPNFAYMILLAAILLSFLAFTTPGTGALELSALFCYVLAGYAAYNLGIRWWAMGILGLGVVPFVLALRDPRRKIYLAATIILLMIGSVFLYETENGLISVHPFIAFISSAITAILLWLLLHKTIEAVKSSPMHNPDALLDKIGEARSSIHEDGSVYIGGEMWSAKSESKIASGSRVRVIRREGFVLVVEKEK